MKKLLLLEFARLKKRTSFFVCTAIAVGLLFLSDLLTNTLLNLTPELASLFSTSVWACLVNALNNSSFTIIAGVFTVLFVCEDYEQHTIKNICARGFTREGVFLAKIISVTVITSVMFVAVELFSLLSSSLFFDMGKADVLSVVFILAVQYVVIIANSLFALAVASAIRKTGISITIIVVAPLILDLVLSIADAFSKPGGMSLTSLWITSNIPYISALSVSDERLITSLAVALFYIALFVFGGLYINKKRDV